MRLDEPGDSAGTAPGTGSAPAHVSGSPDAFAGFCDRRFPLLAGAVLALALFNLAFRIGREVLVQWDESLYAISAWEMVKSGRWIVTTFLGQPDYYNSKPPLNVWLIALSFKAFGIGLVSLRLPCIVSAWATVAVLVVWGRRVVGSAGALLSGVVLSTCFGFLYVHSGRNANTDALFTLLFVLAAVVTWAADRRGAYAAWLGPILAAAFLLRGFGALMLAAFVGAYWLCRPAWLRGAWKAAIVAGVLFLVPVLAWAAARWQVDQQRFFIAMVGYDLLARMARPIEGHRGSVLYYLNILVKHQYDWLLAGMLGLLAAPVWRETLLPLLRNWRRDRSTATVVVWMVVTLLVPTVIRTKVPWYLNTFYPVFALALGALLAHALSSAAASRRRTAALAVGLGLMLLVAESKIVWYSYQQRDLGRSAQGILLAQRGQLAGHTVFRSHWDRSEIFLIGGVIGAERGLAAGGDDFLAQSRPGDFLMFGRDLEHDGLRLVQTDGRRWLYRRER